MPKVDFFVNQFDELIEQKGMIVQWEQAMFCHCYDESTGQPDYNCPYCGGSGFMYLPPIETKVVTTNIDGKFDWTNVGLKQPGTAYATSLSAVLMGYHDRLLFPDFKSKYSEVLTFIDGKSSRLHKPAKAVIKLLSTSADYEQDIDFKISEDGYYLEWINVMTLPEDSTRIPVLYVTSPSYIIIDLLHELRATYAKVKTPEDKFFELPKQFLIQREDFLYATNNGRLD